MIFKVFTGEFKSPEVEAAYLAAKLAETQRLLSFTLTFCAIFYLAFTITDLAALGYGRDFLLLLGARSLVATTAVSFAWLAYRKSLGVTAIRVAACVSEAVALSCFMLIAATRPLEFHWHAMSLAIMLIVIYLYIPNSFSNICILTVSATAGLASLALHLSLMSFADLVTMGMLLVLANAFGALAARRFNRVSREEYRAQTMLQSAAERDHLTGCYNRRYLQHTLINAELKRAQRFGHCLTVVICDIDNFKRINDVHGHATGDWVICAFAKLLNQTTRQGIDSIVRYGGEEFLLILPDTDLSDGTSIAERLRSDFANSSILSVDDRSLICTTASFGVATADFSNGSGTMTVTDLILAADKLMYEAKHKGRNRVRATFVNDFTASKLRIAT